MVSECCQLRECGCVLRYICTLPHKHTQSCTYCVLNTSSLFACASSWPSLSSCIRPTCGLIKVFDFHLIFITTGNASVQESFLNVGLAAASPDAYPPSNTVVFTAASGPDRHKKLTVLVQLFLTWSNSYQLKFLCKGVFVVRRLPS